MNSPSDVCSRLQDCNHALGTKLLGAGQLSRKKKQTLTVQHARNTRRTRARSGRRLYRSRSMGAREGSGRQHPHTGRACTTDPLGRNLKLFFIDKSVEYKRLAMRLRKGLPRQHFVFSLCFFRVFAIYQIMLGWITETKHYETDELPNPRPTQPMKN